MRPTAMADLDPASTRALRGQGPHPLADLPPLYSLRSARARAYDVRMARGEDETAAAVLALIEGRRALIVSTPTVRSLYEPLLSHIATCHPRPVTDTTLVCCERDKTLESVELVCRIAHDAGLGRGDVLVAIGGGVCTDIVTMAASMLRRGIGHVRVPTTLVGQIDAGLGLKGAVNFGGTKSFLGTFWPPIGVVIDPSVLRTLPPRLLCQGLAEIVKIAVVRDSELFALVAEHHALLVSSGFQRPSAVAQRILRLAARGMLAELDANPYEDCSFERLVDFGHTVSPVLEAAAGFALTHGEAVAVDIALSATLAEQLGLLCEADRDAIVSTLRALRLPVFSSLLTAQLCATAMRQAASHRGGQVNLVLPTSIGQAVFIADAGALPEAAFASALLRLAAEADEDLSRGHRATATVPP